MHAEVEALITDIGPDTAASLRAATVSGIFDLSALDVGIGAHAETLLRDSRIQSFVAEFRQRLAPRFATWNLGTVGAIADGPTRRPIDVGLDEMYLPLRMHGGFSLEETDIGAPISPDELLARERPLVIRGPAGTGKTTWMQWTFRRLLERDDAVPCLVELRDLAKVWGEAKPARRTLDTYLRDWVAEWVGGAWQESIDDMLRDLLEFDEGPRPVLLIDGWDEIGDLGSELRQKLAGFLKVFPRVLAVVTSRPYGQGKPTDSDGFETVDIQPLSNGDIDTMAERFFRLVHGADARASEEAGTRFRNEIAASEDALRLARTPLTLTMMLLISRDRSLPDKRHALYQMCIENMLAARPDRKEQEGARLGEVEWRPDDRGARFRALAAMAAQAQQSGYGEGRGQIVMPWRQALRYMPEEWSDDQRRGFLAWLVGAAGILNDRTDGSVAFAHLSFQEYLTAWHLLVHREGEAARIGLCREHRTDIHWWETLRLWAALVHEGEPMRLHPVLRHLSLDGIGGARLAGHGDEQADEIEARAAGFWLAGAMLADGLGAERDMDSWVGALSDAFWMPGGEHADECARAWRRSQQRERRQRIAAAWPTFTPALSWLRWLRARHWLHNLNLGAQAPELAAAPILTLLRGGRRLESADEVANARVLTGASPWWPTLLPELAILRLWPGQRPRVGAVLQLCVSLGASAEELPALLQSMLASGSPATAPAGARVFSRDDVEGDVQSWITQLTLLSDKHLPASSSWGQRLSAASFAQWMLDAAWVDIYTREAEIGGRLAFSVAHDDGGALTPLFRIACRASLDETTDTPALTEAVRALPADTDPLWPALARHVARQSTDADRALLESVARDPGLRAPPLSWGLRFFVRGDVLLADGSVCTLDELCAESGLQPLPALEDMPPEPDLLPGAG
ncbi:NACHT domain-containing protein [Haliangium ochraceum]|uniref:Putative signal transduction protein with Nacht domain n=1 Tax=Haliangium ochraceum (strain DSM 14365 / JCM 11303 / SMP-2) TaxID=502025 RepID=D0LXH1_HALO1|nr:NACHT domain-containing protein [Haliangium ochraceum]ACY17726.1 putative signal transduction protein with Nacht domain [Haliangium ochraceum DSM 14365]